MMRMDLLLNPGTPPPSPVREHVENTNVGTVLPSLLSLDQKREPFPSTPTETVLVANQRPSSSLDEPETPEKPAPKRVKRDLPGVRLLLESVDNQRDDDDKPGIFSGHAFWGKVPSLNQSVSPSDVSQYEAKTMPRISFLGELSSVLPLRNISPAVAEQDATTEPESAAVSVAGDEGPTDEAGEPSSNGSKKKKITICKEEGCKSQALSKQLCMKHGGGPRCSFPDCNNGAKLRNLCFQHGGSTICLAPGCSSKAKRFGYCWSHGGGRICAEEDCNKVAAQGGMCWAHGGGNRCKLPGCTKRSYKQHDYYCKRHAEVSADY